MRQIAFSRDTHLGFMFDWPDGHGCPRSTACFNGGPVDIVESPDHRSITTAWGNNTFAVVKMPRRN